MNALNSAMIQFEGVSKSFDGMRALSDATLTFPPGKTAVLIGPSGCGKSTVLRLIVRLLDPSRGRILVDESDIAGAGILELRRRIGYVIQEGGLFPHLTAVQNVSLMARHLKWDQHRLQERVDELCRLTHLEQGLLTRYPAELSGGQRQRVSLMRSLMLRPDILLLDEPLGALDPMVRASLQAELKDIFSALRTTVIMVTHDMREAVFLGDHIVVMRRGQIVASGTPESLARTDHPFVLRLLESGSVKGDADA